jgi:hypothetical protein
MDETNAARKKTAPKPVRIPTMMANGEGRAPQFAAAVWFIPS